MRNLALFGLLLSVVGCGDDVTQVMVSEVTAQDFEGNYVLDNNSTIELITASDGEVSILSQGQSLNSLNPTNNTLGTFPNISAYSLEPIHGILLLSKNLNYNSNTHDIERDTGGDINGSKRTDVTIYKTETGIRIVIEVYENAINSNINYIVARREFTSK